MNDDMRFGIVAIGDEILGGRTVESNSTYITGVLTRMGHVVAGTVTTGDDEEEIIRAIEFLFKRADCVITTGGLGPTIDDKTISALEKLTGRKGVHNAEVWNHVKNFYERSGLEVPSLATNQAIVLEGARYVLNPVGTAPAQIIPHHDKWIICLPGVPAEMRAMLEPALKIMFEESGHFLAGQAQHRKEIITFGLQEAVLAEMLKDEERWFIEKGGSIGYYPSPGIVEVVVSAPAERVEIVEEFLRKVEEKVGGFLLGEKRGTLEEELAFHLKRRQWTIGTAESCTGGYVAHRITTVPGSSDYFKGSVVAYSNEIKVKVLGVPEHIIAERGAVSDETVYYMLEGVRKLLSVDCAIAISGIAGPSGGTPEKPVGTVWIGVQTPSSRIIKKFNFTGNRLFNIQASAVCALALLIKLLRTDQ